MLDSDKSFHGVLMLGAVGVSFLSAGSGMLHHSIMRGAPVLTTISCLFLGIGVMIAALLAGNPA